MAGKFILKQAVEDLLPNSVVYRKKMGFPTPWEYWLAGPQLDDLEQMLLAPRSMERQLFRSDVVKRVFAEHRAKVRDHGNQIWRLINLEIWQRIMLDGEPAAAVAAHLSSSKPVAAG
jgi:asparagine synthase (glutamine-hydrolysing)